jgi:hypothetical protein
MRVCPCCGYQDPPYWKHVKWSYYIDSCSLESFNIVKPELYAQLLKEGFAEDKNYIYRVSKAKRGTGIPFWVQRKAKIDLTIGWDDACEKFEHLKGRKTKVKYGKYHGVPKDFLKDWTKFHPNQKKLG